MLTSKLLEAKTDSKYSIGYLDHLKLWDHLYWLKWLDMLKILNLKIEIKIRTINWRIFL